MVTTFSFRSKRAPSYPSSSRLLLIAEELMRGRLDRPATLKVVRAVLRRLARSLSLRLLALLLVLLALLLLRLGLLGLWLSRDELRRLANVVVEESEVGTLVRIEGDIQFWLVFLRESLLSH